MLLEGCGRLVFYVSLAGRSKGYRAIKAPLVPATAIAAYESGKGGSAAFSNGREAAVCEAIFEW